MKLSCSIGKSFRFTRGRWLLAALMAILVGGCSDGKNGNPATAPGKAAAAGDASPQDGVGALGRCWHAQNFEGPAFLGPIGDTRGKRRLPIDGYVIVDRAVFGQVWKAWQDGPPPKIDFDRAFVLVGTSGGWGKTELLATRTADNLEVSERNSLGSWLGFSWTLCEVDRADIATINGQPIATRVLKSLPESDAVSAEASLAWPKASYEFPSQPATTSAPMR